MSPRTKWVDRAALVLVALSVTSVSFEAQGRGGRGAAGVPPRASVATGDWPRTLGTSTVRRSAARLRAGRATE